MSHHYAVMMSRTHHCQYVDVPTTWMPISPSREESILEPHDRTVELESTVLSSLLRSLPSVVDSQPSLLVLPWHELVCTSRIEQKSYFDGADGVACRLTDFFVEPLYLKWETNSNVSLVFSFFTVGRDLAERLVLEVFLFIISKWWWDLEPSFSESPLESKKSSISSSSIQSFFTFALGFLFGGARLVFEIGSLDLISTTLSYSSLSSLISFLTFGDFDLDFLKWQGIVNLTCY